ncbi:MAG: signal peptidase II [Opitutaceae bacterium]
MALLDYAATRPQRPSGKGSLTFLSYRRFWTIAVLVLACDQASKGWIATHLAYPTFGPADGGITVIPGFFYVIHVGNTGAAWSMFTGRSAILAVLAAAALVAIYLGRRALALREKWSQLCFGLLCGGIAGNLADRLIHGHVVDFIDLHFGSFQYPTFNVADSSICVGVALYLARSLFHRPQAQA